MLTLFLYDIVSYTIKVVTRLTCLPGYTFKSTTYLILTKMCHFSAFHNVAVAYMCNHPMVGLVINPVYWLMAQQPGPIKMRQATRYLWSYIRNYNRIHYQC